MRGCYTVDMKLFPDDNDGLIPFETQLNYLPLPKKRIWELDFLRALCVVLMILDHLTLCIMMFAPTWYGTSNWYYLGFGNAFTRFCFEWAGSHRWRIAHSIVLVFFFGISGISCTFSRSNYHRGATLMCLALVYSLVTLFLEYGMGFSGIFVTFGVLHFLASMILLYSLVDFLCRRDKRSVAICSVGLCAIALILYFCYTPPESTPIYFAFLFPPEDFWGNPSLFYDQGEVSPGDMFTIVRYLPYFFWGAAAGPFLYRTRESLLPKLDGKWNRPISFVGRHALIIFLFHIPVLMGILSLLTYIFITPGNWGL